MQWSVCFFFSLACLILSIVYALFKAKARYKIGSVLDPAKIMFVGVVLSSMSLFIPIYANAFSENDCGWFETLVIAMHNTIRLFVVDGEFDFITDNLENVSIQLYRCYTVLFSILYLLAPILTFGFVLSFFKNASAYKRYVTRRNSGAYIFSELSERSLALASSLYKHDPKRLLVFTDVFEKDEETNELLEKAKELGAICFKKDIVTINFGLRGKKQELNFFTIGKDQTKNTTQAFELFRKFRDREHTDIYFFSNQVEADALLASEIDKSEFHDEKVKIRCVNENQSLILRNLYDAGYEKIFQSAYDDGSGIKKINAVVLGMGQHGTEMTKALTWFCQMNGYLVRIDSFDNDPLAEEKFVSLCPELMKYSGRIDVIGEAKYTIKINSAINVDTVTFDEKLLSLPRTTYAFVALGNDEKNISTAIKLRTLFARAGYNTTIQAIVYNSEKKEALADIRNFKKEPYDIDFIGDINSSYSEEVILDSDVEEAALKRHLAYNGDERDFWKYRYNYKSSVAAAIHHKMKVLCKIPGAEKMPQERNDDERWSIRILEHNRWNAYTRSEGYVYGGSIEREAGRCDLAKKHNYLVEFTKLPLDVQKQDDD